MARLRTDLTEGWKNMGQTVSGDIADRIRAFAWRIRPVFGPDEAADAVRNGRGLGDTLAMVVAAGHRNALAKGSEAAFAGFDASRHQASLARLRALLRDGLPSGPSGDPASFLEVASRVHVWIAPDGTIVAGPMEDGAFHESAVAILETGRGDWTIETRPPVANDRRVAVAAMIADRLEDLLAPVKGRVTQTCRPGAAAFAIAKRVDRRWCETGRADDHLIGELVIRHEPDALEAAVDAIVCDVREAHDRHGKTMERLLGKAHRIEEAMAANRLHVRIHVVDDGDYWSLFATHLGTPVGSAFFPCFRASSLIDLEKYIDAGLDRALAGRLDGLRRYLPENVTVGSVRMDATLMQMVRAETSNADEADAAMRRIFVHGQRRWSARDLGDLFGHPVDATLATNTSRAGTFGAIIQLSDDVTMKNGTLVIRRGKLPQTIVDTLAGRRVRDVVGHPWIPDTTVVRTQGSAAGVGETYSLMLEEPYEQLPKRRMAA